MNLTALWNKKPLYETPGEPSAGGAPEGDAAPEAPAAPDYSFVPEQFRTDDGVDGDAFKIWMEDLQATKSQVDERLAEVPEDAAGYEFALPDDISYGDDLLLPENFSVNFKADDPDMKPLFSELAGFLHQNGIPQTAAPQLMGMLAKYEAVQMSRQQSAIQAERAALGEGEQGRCDRLQRTIESRLPEDQAMALMRATNTAAGVRALEALFSPKAMNSSTPQPPEKKQTSSAALRYPTSVAS